MKSKAQIKGHPLHPILVSFPIAFFTGTLLFDLLGLFLGRPGFHLVAYYLEMAGIAFGLLAAVPGIIDFIFTVPPKSSGKKRAATHGLTNTTMILVFTTALILRRNEETSLYLVIGLEVVGAILLSIAGWLGGTLVYRNQVGVDIRYANAGKWKEEYIDDVKGEIRVADKDELEINQMKLLHVKGKRIVLCKSEEGYAAFEDHCTHRGGSLAGGSMICGTVQCPWHGSQFDVRTGMVKAGPAKEGIHTYVVKQMDDGVYLTLL
jgi:uncharacterized membrane protein/nitrite reductase/ring-hydroxylating ferredoxin subunit